MNKHGFTLLEVALFFGITSLLALLAFAGLGPRLRNVRFTDAVRTLESTTQRQLSDFQSGVNTRPANIGCTVNGDFPELSEAATGQTAGSSANCIINGRAALFSEESVRFYPVVSVRKTSTSCSPHPTYGELFCYGPTIVGYASSVSESSYNNGLRMKADPTVRDVAILYLQDPNGTETRLMPLNAAQVPTTGVYKIEVGDVGSSFLSSFCVELSGRSAKLEYNENGLKPTITFEGC